MDESPAPLPNGSNGRDSHGRFIKGNPGGPGNPYGKKVASLRNIILDTVSGDDVAEVVKTLIVLSKQGDITAIKVLFQYVIGQGSITSQIEHEYNFRKDLNHSKSFAVEKESDQLCPDGWQDYLLTE